MPRAHSFLTIRLQRFRLLLVLLSENRTGVSVRTRVRDFREFVMRVVRLNLSFLLYLFLAFEIALLFGQAIGSISETVTDTPVVD
jgi:hypothetical protein